MARKVIIFAGAPSASSVDTASCTLDGVSAAFNDFLGRSSTQGVVIPPSSYSHAAWRSLSLKRQPLHTGFSQTHDLGDDDSLWDHRKVFFTTADVSYEDPSTSLGDGGAAEILTEFCEQSLAAHNGTPSDVLDSLDQSMSDETSFMTNTSADRTGVLLPGEPPVPLHLSDLEDVPPAHSVLLLAPQTITVNLIAGIISIAQPRTVTTRWGKTLSLVEVVVGDDTASGFGMTFWLDSKAPLTAVSNLRRQDVVLMQNVALHVFRGKVYGQTLRRGLTKVEVLWRADGTGYYSSRLLAKTTPTAHPQRQKTARVRDWVLHFVGADSRTRQKKSSVKSWDVPPDDTQ